MPVDVHAHYFPPAVLNTLADRGADLGIAVLSTPPACQQCLQFAYGLKVRPFPGRLIEDAGQRAQHMHRHGITRQILSGWTDIFGYGLPPQQGRDWHRLMNDALADVCLRHPQSFSWLASGALPDAGAAAHELERAIREGGAIGGVVAANVEGRNLGDLGLDEYWSTACELDVPVFIHPVQAQPTPRTEFFSLNPIVQYTFDTTLTVGSLISSGVLDRFPGLKLILSHGGGAFPYLIGRFDWLHRQGDRKTTGNVARDPPSTYLDRFHYDSILHNAKALRFLADMVGTQRMLLGTDDPFPPADQDPLDSLRKADFDADTIHQVADANPARLFRL